jgi:hypothetical protein
MNFKTIILMASVLLSTNATYTVSRTVPTLKSSTKHACNPGELKIFHAFATNDDGKSLKFSISEIMGGSAVFVKNNKPSVTISSYSPGAALAQIKFTPNAVSATGCYCFKLTVMNGTVKKDEHLVSFFAEKA